MSCTDDLLQPLPLTSSESLKAHLVYNTSNSCLYRIHLALMHPRNTNEHGHDPKPATIHDDDSQWNKYSHISGYAGWRIKDVSSSCRYLHYFHFSFTLLLTWMEYNTSVGDENELQWVESSSLSTIIGVCAVVSLLLLAASSGHVITTLLTMAICIGW